MHPRRIGKPQDMVVEFDKLVALFTPSTAHPYRGWCPHTNAHVLGKAQTQDKLASLRHHIAKGCLADPEDVALYINLGTTSRPKLYCCRGTNALEGFHQHLRRFFSGHSVSPRLGQALIMAFVHRWNSRKDVHVRQRQEFGHLDLPLMHLLHNMEVKVGLQSGSATRGVVGLPNVEAFADTNEEFCFGKYAPLTDDLLDAEIRTFVELSQDVADEDSMEGPTWDDRAGGEELDAASLARYEASMQDTPIQQVVAALAALKPSHRWLALKEKMFRPSLSPTAPSEAELALAHEIKVASLHHMGGRRHAPISVVLGINNVLRTVLIVVLVLVNVDHAL